MISILRLKNSIFANNSVYQITWGVAANEALKDPEDQESCHQSTKRPDDVWTEPLALWPKIHTLWFFLGIPEEFGVQPYHWECSAPQKRYIGRHPPVHYPYAWEIGGGSESARHCLCRQKWRAFSVPGCAISWVSQIWFNPNGINFPELFYHLMFVSSFYDTPFKSY